MNSGEHMKSYLHLKVERGEKRAQSQQHERHPIPGGTVSRLPQIKPGRLTQTLLKCQAFV